MTDQDQPLHAPAFRIEHRRSDIAPGVIGFADTEDEAVRLIATLRRDLLAKGADGVLIIINQGDEPEQTVASHKVDNRVSTRPAPGSR